MNENTFSVSVDEDIYSYIKLDNPKSFFLFAGAGSGKTRCLVNVLKKFRNENILRLKKNAQKVAVITYTNAACDEIKNRLDFDSAFHVSTIHSFAWDLINPYTNDIRTYLNNSLKIEIDEIREQQSNGRMGTKAAIDRASKIESKQKRLELLEQIKKFSYNPNGDNINRDSLNHTEVIRITANLIQTKPLMQSILVRKYPILLIDESQDTNKELIDAFFEVQNKKSTCFSLGMFGDTMQRIFADGKLNLEQSIPDSWEKPVIEINHRSPKRVITLINKIRSGADNQTQQAYKNSAGIVRLFIVNATDSLDKNSIESEIASTMATITGDEGWTGSQDDVKVLTLEHHMAAKRGGFSKFFDPLYSVGKLKTGLLDGTLPGIALFANQILPLIKAKQAGNKFTVSKIVREYSPLLNKEFLKNSSNAVEEIRKANIAVNSLFELWENGEPSLNDTLKEVFSSGIFKVPDILLPIAKRLNMNQETPLEEADDESEIDLAIDAWDEALKCSFNQFEQYVLYITDKSRFGTHQGIKGLQFPRVMVILDDEEARGFLFSYEKLFGAKEPTRSDIHNQAEGKETSIDRTRRLFYVTCSRAQESLAIVVYTNKVQQFAIQETWFESEEIININD